MNTRNNSAEMADPMRAALKRLLGTHGYVDELTDEEIQESIAAVGASPKTIEVGGAVLQARLALAASSNTHPAPPPSCPQLGLPLAIMNMPIPMGVYTEPYLLGHRDARYAASDIALKWGYLVIVSQAEQKPVAKVSSVDEGHACVELLGDVIIGIKLFAAPLPAAYSAAAQRPTDDALWDQTLKKRDDNADMADKLAAAIATHFGVDIGEHSSANCPWQSALNEIESHPTLADVQVG